MYKLMLAALIATLLGLAGCEREGPMERAGERIDEAAEDVEQAAEDAGHELEDACEEATDENC